MTILYFTIEKIEKQLGEIRATIHRQVQDIKTFKFIEQKNLDAYSVDYDDSGWKEFEVGEYWGGYDITAWFRARVRIPEGWKKEKLHLRFLVGPRDGGDSTAETLLYVNGKPLQGIDVWHEEAWLPPEWIKGDEITIALKAWSGVLGVPERRHFKLAQLILIDEPAEHFYYMADTVLKAVKVMDENDMRRHRLIEVLNKAFYKIDYLKPRSDAYYYSLVEAEKYLQSQLEEMQKWEKMKPTVTGVGHSHIDMAWLWRLEATREKASRTFSTVLNLMRQYPEYRFLHSSPQLYKFLKTDYPEIYEQIRQKIASGEWEITGGMWVEPDTNVPNGESLVRQILFGKRFMKEEFGVVPNLVWLPDVFGYSWALPQLIKKSGMKYFMTTKISWNQYNRFPYDTFRWRGIDGTEVLTHFITTPEDGSWHYTYNGPFQPEDVDGIWKNYRQKDINDELLLAFGWGDGGGGPTKEMLEAARAMKNIPGLPKVKIDKAEPYFERLEKRLEGQNVDVWDGELYLEYHRGTYTSQAFIKRANRKAEVLYHNAEWLNTISDLLTGQQQYPVQELNKGWEMILLNQFHDILPGSSIRQVYEDCKKDYEVINGIGQYAANQAQQAILKQIHAESDGIVVFNPISWERDELVKVPFSEKIGEKTVFIDENGGLIPAQCIEEAEEKYCLIEAPNLPSLGYKTIRTENGANNTSSSHQPMVISKNLLENNYYKIELNQNGQIVSLYDKVNNRQVLDDGHRANIFQVFEDKPMNFDAWDIDIYYQQKMKEITDLVEVEVEEEGPLRGTLRLVWRFSDSVIIQRIRIYRTSPRIDFDTEVDWKEKQVLLKVAFPVNVRSTKATYDIQFGNIERPTHWNTQWDFAKFESVGHKWVDLSEGNYGVALLNDCKYGHDIKDNVIRLTLIKSSVRPDETADRCKHVFTYSLLPHKGTWREANVVQQSYGLNYPAIVGEVTSNPEGKMPSNYEFAKLNADHAIIETVKKAEDGEAWVVRLYEYKQYRNHNVELSFANTIQKVVECNLMEEEEIQANFQENKISFSLAPYEIKTFKVWF